jgi:hypothetical protein
MGPYAITIVVVASVLAVFLAVMAYRGLVADVDPEGGAGSRHCRDCHRDSVFPLSTSHQCWRCQRSDTREHWLHGRAAHALGALHHGGGSRGADRH